MASFISSCDFKYIYIYIYIYFFFFFFFLFYLVFFIEKQSSFPNQLSSIPFGGAGRTVQCIRACDGGLEPGLARALKVTNGEVYFCLR